MTLNGFVETFSEFDGHWIGYRCRVEHSTENHRLHLIPNRTDGDYYSWTGTAKPGQRPDYPLFGDKTGAMVSVDVGLHSGSFSDAAGNVHIFVAYCPTGTQYLTLWSAAFVRAADLTRHGTTIRARLVESEWPEAANTDNFGFEVDRAYVFSHLDEVGVTHHKPWNGTDDGILWFDNVKIVADE